MFNSPAILHALLEHLTTALITYVEYQIEAGAQVGAAMRGSTAASAAVLLLLLRDGCATQLGRQSMAGWLAGATWGDSMLLVLRLGYISSDS